MNYGFLIDNRMCIGCHACTVACKSEHDVPIGVNRTHVKYIEKGIFPNSKREFSVHRCNHCLNAPCVEICPTTALYNRDDGIVDFDNDRCIGCKSCMQACPYDALYIDPDTNTAAKCNYCAHRLDGGYEPACVIVCPVEAIISGDLNDPQSKIANLVSKEDVMTRKPEKGTIPNLYYINGTNDMLDPLATEIDSNYVSTDQSKGVGHYAKYAEERVNESSNHDLLIQLAMENSAKTKQSIDQRAIDNVAKDFQKNVDSKNEPKRVYDSPNKGVLWGWEVPAYVCTKAIATGTLLMTIFFQYLNGVFDNSMHMAGLSVTLFFMMMTGLLLVIDLDRPDRFLYVLLRPQWKSWLVRGAYIITCFTALVIMKLAMVYFNVSHSLIFDIIISISAILCATYTAFLFAQAKARDHWQKPWLNSFHMFLHALISGAAIMIVIVPDTFNQISKLLFISLAINLILVVADLFFPHKTPEGKKTILLMTKGHVSKYLWAGIILGNLMPMTLLMMMNQSISLIGILAIVGIFLTEFVRIRVPQMIPLS